MLTGHCHAATPASRGQRSVWLKVATVLAVVWFSLGTPQRGLAARLGDKDPSGATRTDDPSYQAVFSRMELAWRAGDQKVLANLVHPDGLNVLSRGSTERTVSYSPSQAFYYFRNLFQNGTLGSFTMTRIQAAPQGDRVHGLARWEYTTAAGQVVTKMVIVLARHEDRWFLSEITTIK